MDMSCMCAVQREEAKRLANLATKNLESFSIEQLEHRSQAKKATIIALDTVRANQMPNMKNLYTAEQSALIKGLQNEDGSKKISSEDYTFEIFIEIGNVNARASMRHFLNLNTVVELMLDQCRYFHVPIGNMPPDTVLFGADLFFARLLQKHNFVLCWSPTTRPDLGGREADDSRLLAEFEDSVPVVQNHAGFYPNVCIELALAVSALLQSTKIQELEGASSAVT
uniref:DNA polymerase epsilon catalytic subunit n=1 Tax=Glossina morsitans morsitans TaxID=37546 RepID=A0A1B0FAK8_GLOMM